MLADATQALLTLAGIFVLLFGLLWLARKSGPTASVGPIELAGRLFLEPRRSIYLIRVHDRILIVGGSEAGLTKLGELPGDAIPPLPSQAVGLRALLRLGKIGRRRPRGPE